MLRIHGNKFKHLAGLSYAGLAGSSAAFLLILAAMLFAPSISQPEASAVEDNSGISTYAATPTVGISLPTSIDFADVLPTPSGATTTATADLTITTTDSAGYSLYLYSSDGDNSLKPKISSLANISTINATAGDVGLTLSSLKPNTWGYNLGTEAPTDTTKYSAVPTDNSTPIQTKDTSDTNSANDTYTLAFGAKVDTMTASGAYSNTLTIAVVAEPPKITLSQITNMQDMTSEICSNSAEDETKRLIDIRDGKLYWVAKLADGNCWMTQNLDLDIPESGLSVTNTDITEDWNNSSEYPPETTKTSTPDSISYQSTQSYDPGLYARRDPLSTVDCSMASSSFSNCAATEFVDVSSMQPMEEINSSGEVIQGNYYDAHYLIGNFYQWNTATAGTGASTAMGENATDSICPKGWRLPINSNTGEEAYSYSHLLNAYNLPSSSSEVDKLMVAPFYFMRSGYIYDGGIMSSGAAGHYWTSTTSPSMQGFARELTLSSTVFSSTGSTPKSWGASVRCLAY